MAQFRFIPILCFGLVMCLTAISDTVAVKDHDTVLVVSTLKKFLLRADSADDRSQSTESSSDDDATKTSPAESASDDQDSASSSSSVDEDDAASSEDDVTGAVRQASGVARQAIEVTGQITATMTTTANQAQGAIATTEAPVVPRSETSQPETQGRVQTTPDPFEGPPSGGPQGRTDGDTLPVG